MRSRLPNSLSLIAALALFLCASIAEGQSKLGEVAVTADNGAEIYVDGQPMGTAPLPLPLALPAGEHTIEARLRGRSAKVTMVVANGTKSAAALSFASASPAAPALPPAPSPAPAAAPVAAPPPAAAPPPPVETPAEPESSSESAEIDTGGKREPFMSWAGHNKVAWIGGGLTVIGLVSGITFAIVAGNNYGLADDYGERIRDQKQQDGYSGPVCKEPPTGEYGTACGKFTDAQDIGDGQRTLSLVSFVVAGVAATGTVVYYIVDTKRKSPNAARAGVDRVGLAPVVTPGAGGLAVVGTF